MSSDIDGSDSEKKIPVFPNGLPETKVRSYVTVTDPDSVDSFLDPVRRAILVTLRNGMESKREDTSEETITREDGTTVRTTIVEEKVVKRFWMTVPEIVDNNIGETPVSKYNCYYHLPKLVELGLVEAFTPEGKESSTKRGIYYRRTAKVFMIPSSKMSDDIVKSYLTLFDQGFEVEMTEKVHAEIEDLLVKQVQMIDEAVHYLAVNMKEVEIDSTSLSEMLSVMATIFLSDNVEFLKIQKRLKNLVLTPCCGTDADLNDICSFCGDPLANGTALKKQIDGTSHTFCDEECATSYERDCTTEC